MARHYRGMALRPIHRIKHVIDFSGTLAKATQIETVLIQSVDAPVIATPQQNETGSKVNGIYLRVEVGSNDVADPGIIPQVYLSVFKKPANLITTPSISIMGQSPLKKYSIHQEMVMLENTGQGGNSKTLFNGVVKIPKGYIRNGPDDRLVVVLLSPQLDISFCIQCHYKEFR